MPKQSLDMLILNVTLEELMLKENGRDEGNTADGIRSSCLPCGLFSLSSLSSSLMENTKCIRLQRKTLKMLHLLLYAMQGAFLFLSEPRLYYVVTMASSIDDSMLLY